MSAFVARAAMVTARTSSRNPDGVAVLVASLLFLAFHAAGGFPTLADGGGDNDSVLRMVQVRDLLAGQGWFDPVQYRMGLEGGFAMHWSRLVDLPIAAIIAAVETVTGSQSLGEAAALVAWPALLFALALLLIVRSARALGGEWAVLPAAVVGGLALHFINVFRPGALDHHNVQLVLALAALLFLLRARQDPRAGALAGTAAALMLAVGMETAPYVAVACAVAALSFLLGGPQGAREARGFGAAFAAASAAVLVATLPPRDWLAVQCDAFSLPQAALAVLGGGGLALIAATPALGAGFKRRLAALGGLGMLAAAALALFPQCLAGPYADLDPRLQSYWLGAISEARSIGDILGSDHAAAIRYYATPLIALAVTLWALARRGFDRNGAIVAGFLGAAVLVSFWQLRGATFSIALAAIPLSAWIAGVRRRTDGNRKILPQLAAAACWLVSINVLWSVAATPLAAAKEGSGGQAEARTCYAYADYDALAALPKGTVAAITNQGSSILRQTPHRALIGPYHRNQAGALAALDILTADPGEAEAVARGHGVSYVALCRDNPETALLTRSAPEGLLAGLAAGEVPDWLSPVPETAGQAIEIFRVGPAGG